MNAQVFMLGGKQPTDTNVAALVTGMKNASISLAKPLPAEASALVRAKAKPGDLYDEISDVPDEDMSVCGIQLPQHLDDPEIVALQTNVALLKKLPARCAPVKSSDSIAVLELPPWPRFD